MCEMVTCKSKMIAFAKWVSKWVVGYSLFNVLKRILTTRLWVVIFAFVNMFWLKIILLSNCACVKCKAYHSMMFVNKISLCLYMYRNNSVRQQLVIKIGDILS